MKIFIDIEKLIYDQKLIGLVLINIGIVMVIAFFSVPLSLKLGIIFIFTAFILLFSLDDNEDGKKYYALIQKGTIVWIILAFIASFNESVELFIMITILGLLTIQVLTEKYVSKKARQRLHLLFTSFLLIFLLLLGQRIINILSI